MEPPPSQRLPSLRDILARFHRQLVILALLLSGISLIATGFLTVRSYFERNLALVARSISYTVEPAVVFNDKDALQEGIRSTASLHDVRFVELRDTQGRLIGHWFNTDTPAKTTPTWGERLLGVPGAVAPIKHGDSVIGSVRVAGDISVLTNYLLSGLLSFLCCLGIAIIAMRILARHLEEGVIRPLREIAAVAHAVRLDRALERRVAPSGIAELDTFGRDFNALLEELEGWHVSLREEKDRFEHRSMHDPLTNLGNRALFDRMLKAAVADAERCERSFALFYLDADHFKAINDRHGHLAGDAMLKALGERLRGSIRPIDHAFRLGGDEFAVILGPLLEEGMPDTIVENIRGALSAPIELPDSPPITPSISIGCAIYPDHGHTPVDLVRLADEQMYQDKLRKRGPEMIQETHA